MENMPGINYNTQRSGIANIADSNQNIPGQKNQDNPPAVSPQLPVRFKAFGLDLHNQYKLRKPTRQAKKTVKQI